MSTEFKNRLVKNYTKDKKWAKILTELKKGPMTNIQFRLKDKLIFYKDFEKNDRLCLPKFFDFFFVQAYDENVHFGFHKTYETITTMYFFRKFTKRFLRYIHYCHECNFNNTKCHRPNGVFLFIMTVPIPHHIVTINFIFGFFMTADVMDAGISIICKFFKRTTVLANKSIYITED